jgi:hypothetical protein
LLLILRRSGGEESLPQSHGLSVVGWSQAMAGELHQGLGAVGTLAIETTGGLFTSFVEETSNVTCIHVRSSRVDWRLPYPVPTLGASVTLDDLLLRMPDLHHEHQQRGLTGLYAAVNEMTFTKEAGFSAKVLSAQFDSFSEAYSGAGYTVARSAKLVDLRCDAATFERCRPQFVHTYVHKTFRSIPSLHLAKPFAGEQRYSQLAITYMLSYFLGMLSRYFPTHWIALLTGEKGDALWPSLSGAQRYVESCFPELVDEFLHDALRQADASNSAGRPAVADGA